MHGTHSLPLETLLDPTVRHSQCVTCSCMHHTTGMYINYLSVAEMVFVTNLYNEDTTLHVDLLCA